MVQHLRPIIFLDMDGVLNSDAAFEKCRRGIHPPENIAAMTVDPVCVAWLARLVKLTKAQIVISSSWRSGIMDDLQFTNRYGNKTVLDALRWGGFDAKSTIIGNTPKFNQDNFTRGDEIQYWMRHHSRRYVEGKTPYVILDDDTDFLVEQLTHCVFTDAVHGLTEQEFNLAFRVLNLTQSP